MLTQSSILSSQVNTRMMCLYLHLNYGGYTHSNEGMYPSSYLMRDFTKLPLDQGLASNIILGGDHGTTNFLNNSSFQCHDLVFLYSRVFIFFRLLRRASIIHHFYSWIISSMSPFLLLESDPLVHIWPFLPTSLPSSHHVSFSIFHPTTWVSFVDGIYNSSFRSPALAHPNIIKKYEINIKSKIPLWWYFIMTSPCLH